MKKLPEKIYATPNFDRRWQTKAIDDESVEYVRKDAFIEKACEVFCKVRCKGNPPRSTCTSLGTCIEYDEFKNAMRL